MFFHIDYRDIRKRYAHVDNKSSVALVIRGGKDQRKTHTLGCPYTNGSLARAPNCLSYETSTMHNFQVVFNFLQPFIKSGTYTSCLILVIIMLYTQLITIGLHLSQRN